MLPFHVITRLQGQPFADLDITSYDLKSAVPAATTHDDGDAGKSAAEIREMIGTTA